MTLTTTRTWNRSLLGALSAGVLTLCFALAGWSMPPGGEPDPGRMVRHLERHLDLSEEQLAAVETAVADLEAATAGDRGRLHELREALRDTRDSFDAGQAQQLADELGEISTRLAFNMARAQATIYGELNTEQRAQMDELLQRRKHHRRHWRKRGGEAFAPVEGADL